jgi:hypothetical protein
MRTIILPKWLQFLISCANINMSGKTLSLLKLNIFWSCSVALYIQDRIQELISRPMSLTERILILYELEMVIRPDLLKNKEQNTSVPVN